jgi:hypothetical protein
MNMIQDYVSGAWTSTHISLVLFKTFNENINCSDVVYLQANTVGTFVFLSRII